MLSQCLLTCIRRCFSELRIFGGVIGEAMVCPVEAPEPLGSAEGLEAQDVRKAGVPESDIL